MNGPPLLLKVLCAVIICIPATAFPQENQTRIGSGLDLHLLIDCSLSIWQPKDAEELRTPLREILYQVIANLRAIDQDGDRIAIYFFANRLQKITSLIDVGYGMGANDSLWAILTEILVLPDTPSIDSLNLTISDFNSTLRELIDNHISPQPARPRRTKVVLIVSDGINDPDNDLPFMPTDVFMEEAQIVEYRKIANRLSEFRNLLKTKVCMIHLPYKRPSPNFLTYAHTAAWDSLLGNYRFAAKTLDLIEPTVKEAFIEMRSILVQEICVKTRFLSLDKWGRLDCKLEFITPQLRHQSMDINIKLTAVYDSISGRISVDQGQLTQREKDLLLVTRNIRGLSRKTITAHFKLPKKLYRYKEIVDVDFKITPSYTCGSLLRDYLVFFRDLKCEPPESQSHTIKH